jgi:hypothetical protein
MHLGQKSLLQRSAGLNRLYASHHTFHVEEQTQSPRSVVSDPSGPYYTCVT